MHHAIEVDLIVVLRHKGHKDGEKMSTTWKVLEKHLEKSKALEAALTLFSWDSETLAPKASNENTSKFIGILSAEQYHAIMNDEVRSLLVKLEEQENFEKLTNVQQKIIQKLREQFDELEKISPEDYQDYCELESRSYVIWEEAKEKSDFKIFEPTLKKVIEYRKKFAKACAKPGESPYDYLLRQNEECFNQKFLDQFFEELKETIVPLLKKAKEKEATIAKDYNTLYYDPLKQEKFCHFLAEYIGFDFERGVIAESAHPFTTNFHNKDVRITNHFYDHNLESAMFSVIHEGGHALYEMGIRDDISMTMLGTGTSMGMHESQSRLYENIIGRSKSFWKPIYPKLQETFKEQLGEVSLETFVQGINKAMPSLVRTEADELSYTLHIIIRYEIEKELFADEIEVEDLPSIWNQKYEEYLGVTPSNDAEGVLQDVHWAGGMFGYFPSYALGSAIAAQMMAHMKKIMPIDTYLEEGNLAAIREYLDEHVHQYGRLKNTNEILMDMMGEPLSAHYFTDYLKDKFEI